MKGIVFDGVEIPVSFGKIKGFNGKLVIVRFDFIIFGD